MKLFFDTEFTGLHQHTNLISIGIVSEEGETFYAEFTDFDVLQVNDWIQENVIDNMKWRFGVSVNFATNINNTEGAGTTEEVKSALLKWLSKFDKIEMWSDCLAYDWVLFCQIFGGAFGIPPNVFYIPFDISTLMKENGIDPDINREGFAGNFVEVNDPHNWGAGKHKHNALWDAYVIRQCYKKLTA